MDFSEALIVVMIVLVEIQGKSLDPGPQVLNESLKLPHQSSQKRYATKEIILYLTPSQIRALQEGRGLISPRHFPQIESDKHTQSHPPNVLQNYDNHLHQHLGHLQQLKSPTPHLAPVEEPHSDHFVPIIPPPEYRQSDNYAYINFKPQNQQHEPVPFFPETHGHIDHYRNSTASLHSLHKPFHDRTDETQSFPNHLKEQLYRLLDQNRAQLEAYGALRHLHGAKSTEQFKDLLHYALKFSDQKNALDVEQLANNNQQHQLGHQHALSQAEAIANSPPVIVHKEINIKHSPVHLIKQIKVPVPTPVLIPIPEPFEVKVPQPYPVPFEIIKPVPVPILKTQKIEVEKHVPVEIEKPYLVEKPYFLERGIPVEIPLHKSESLPIHSLIRKH